MKILITGGCGFIGSNLSNFLKNKKYKVETLDNLQRKGSVLNLKLNKKNKIKNHRVDIANFKKINSLPKYDIIIDCCAEPSVEASKKNLDRVFNTNLIGTLNILKKCIKDKSKLIFLSSSRVYSIKSLSALVNKNQLNKEFKLNKEIDLKFDTSAPRSIYGYTKLSSEELIKELSYSFKIKYLINRLGVIAGPRQMGKVDQGFFSLWIWKHLNKMPLKYIGYEGYGSQKRDVLHIDDLKELIFLQIKKIKKINNLTLSIGGGKKNLLSLRQLTKICVKLTGNNCSFSSSKKTSIYDIPYFCTSNTLVKKIYGWVPKRNINRIALDILNWQKQDYKKLKKYL